MKRGLTLSLVFVSLFFIAPYANAEEISISGNGAGSESQVNINVEQNQNVNQSNDANIQNDVDVNANTGGNDANDNTGGDVNISTGSIDSNVDVNNKGINVNAANNNACPSNCPVDFNTDISKNGADSENSVSVNANNNVNASQNNEANIENNVNVNANTGYNEANDNNGDVTINTGDIQAETRINNKNINKSFSETGFGVGRIFLEVNGNGADSENDIDFTYGNFISVENNNFARVFNNVLQDLNTGGNSANDNLGSVLIATGDIDSVVDINNEGINTNVAKVVCCEEEEQPTEEEKPPVGGEVSQPEAVTTSTKEDEDEGEAAAEEAEEGEVLGVSAEEGEVLPITGNLALYLATLFGVLMFIFGLYLRQSSDVSPPGLS